MIRRTAIVGTLVLAAGAAMAQQATDHSGTSHDAPADGAPSTAAFMKAMDKMHADMAIDYSGDADVDFVKGMIPHHQGAIDMARIELEYGKNPELRKMAEEIIAAQEEEIARMQDWLKTHGH